MKVSVHQVARRKLDLELKPYREAGKDRNPTKGLLRAVRKALRIHSPEVAERIGMSQSAVFGMESREANGSITLRAMDRLAEAMDCKLVYAVVPMGGRTLEQLYQERLWAAVLGTGIRKAVVSDQSSVVSGQWSVVSGQLSVVSCQ